MSNIIAAGMPVVTNSELWPLRVAGTGESARMRMKGERGQAQTPALSPDGRPTYSSGCILRLLDKEGKLRSDKTASVHVINAVPDQEFEPGEYKAEGLIWFQPYLPDGQNRVHYSVTCESLVRVDAVSSVQAAPNRKDA